MSYLKNEGPAEPINQYELPYFLTPMYLALKAKIPRQINHTMEENRWKQEDNTND